MKIRTSHQTKLFDIAGKIEMLVGYERTEKKYPITIEECHGPHRISEDELIISLSSVEIVVPGGMAVDILPMLTEKQKEYITNQID